MTEPQRPPVDFVAVLGQCIDAGVARAEAAIPAKVERFNRANQTANVTPQVLRGKRRPPVVVNVPVVFPGAYYDVQQGEFGLLICCGRNPRTWWRTGEVSPPEDLGAHELNNGIFLPGLRTMPNPRAIDAGTIVLEAPTPTGEVRLGGHDADESVLCGDSVENDLNNVFAKIASWASFIEGALRISPSSPQIGDLNSAIASYLTGVGHKSNNVKVKK